ncbi:MAG: right-handed parallel beta-helix repeat-containing protein [Acidobacteriota bacterium]
MARLLGNPELPTVHIRDTHDVKVSGLRIVGGEYGVLVERSQEVVIRENFIESIRRFGIRVRNASASIVENTVVGGLPPYGKGIHITNTTEWPGSLVQGNRVEDNAQEGILTNMTHVIIRDNIVRNNGLRGIAITEMSMATVENNVLLNNVDIGLYVSDMSMAQVERNRIGGTRPGELGRAHAILVEYYSDVWLLENLLDEDSDGVVAWNNSQIDGDTVAWGSP